MHRAWTIPDGLRPSIRVGLTKCLRLVHDRLVMAESAVDLFERSHYDDLITFEAHIAQISELVLLVCEGPGALAELGAFSQLAPIRDRLYVVMRDDHNQAHSFVRLGPVKALLNDQEDKVGAFPWRVDSDGNILEESLAGLDETIADEINSQLRPDVTEAVSWDREGHQIILIYWVCFMLRAATVREIEYFLKGAGYDTRYADDVTLSGGSLDAVLSAEREFRQIVAASTSPRLRFNEEKRGVYTRGMKRMVTGLKLTPDGRVSLGRDRKRAISVGVHHALLGKLSTTAIQRVRGWLAFANAVEPQFLDTMRRKYGKGVDEILKLPFVKVRARKPPEAAA